MALVQGRNLARSFGAEDIFEGITVSIPHNARIALVGPNGAGKTTLLRLLAGLDRPTQGEVYHAKDLQIGFLPQQVETQLNSKNTVYQEMLLPFSELIEQEKELQQMAQEIADNPEKTSLVEAYGEAQTAFEMAGGYEYPIRIQRVLGGLGFKEDDFDRPVEQLSGGQKTRSLLARLLLEEPDLLILDEPTNHLDIHAIEWLEAWLRGFAGALLLVSHDRYFMDTIADHVWELIFGQLEIYRGDYSHYARQKEERHTRLLAEYERQQQFIEKEKEYIRRNIAGQNTRQAQGRRKRLERFLQDEAFLSPREHREMRLDLKSSTRSGDEVIKTHDLSIGYHDDGVSLFTVPDITLYRGECAALIGPNGVGKSTFMKTILGRLEPLEGTAKLGAGVQIGYFAQAHEELQEDRTILEEVRSIQPLPVGEARNYLASFLFTGDDVFKSVSMLSGGERGRVALAKLALSGANLLLLDEPTNHLDIPSQEILESVLDHFTGTILLISHDRYLIKNLATQIWSLESTTATESLELTVFEGRYDSYIAWRSAQRSGDRADKVAAKQTSQPSSAPAKGRVLTPYQRQKRIDQVEARIDDLETDLESLKGNIAKASVEGYVEQIRELGDIYAVKEKELNDLLEEWEQLHAT